MDMKDIAPGMLLVDGRGKLCVVTAIDMHRPKNPVVYKHGSGRTTYIGPPEFFRASVGTVDLGKFETAMTVGTAPARDDSFQLFGLPDELKGLKVGDMIKIRNRGRIEEAEFVGYNPNRPKNPVSIRIGGREYKAPAHIVIREGALAPKRSEKEIMADILTAYCGLSPENLTSDGELPRSTVEAKRRRLEAELRRLFAELGREVTEEEAYQSERA